MDEEIRKVVEAGWKSEDIKEDPRVRLAEARAAVYQEIHNHSAFTPEETGTLEKALDEVQHSVLKKLPPERVDIRYISNQGGAENYIKDLLLQKTALIVDSPETMRSILSHGMLVFFHSSGQELYTEPNMWKDAKAAWSRWEWLR